MYCTDSKHAIQHVLFSVNNTLFVFGFWSLLATKLRKYKILRKLCLHFARQDGQDGKKWKENHATKVTKIPNTAKNQKRKIWDEHK